MKKSFLNRKPKTQMVSLISNPNKMKDVIEFLQNSSLQYLATIGLDQKPKVRPFQFMFEHDEKLWFCTSNQKEVYRELQLNPNIELCATNEEMSWIRIRATVIFSKDIHVKEKVLHTSPLVKSIYKEAINPNFEVFYLDKPLITISKIGEKPKSIKL